jgi:hemerythrin-like domain-containing protein
MRIIRILNTDQELVNRFLAVLGSGLVVAGHSKSARPGFFVFACNFIHQYLEPVYFKKEEVLLNALEDCGFSPDDGPLGSMHTQQQKSCEISKALFDAAKQWKSGDEAGRAEVIYAASEYTGILHQHFDLLKNLIQPLLEQSLTPKGELKAAEDLNRIAFDGSSPESIDKYVKIVEMLEEEVGEWK